MGTTEHYYRAITHEVEVFETCFRKQLPLLLKGPTGCGKSQLVAHMAERLQVPLIKVACNEDTTSADLLGRFLIQGMETVWHDGPVTRAVRHGGILYLDEIAEAREDVIVALHPLTDHRRELYLDRTNESLQAPAHFMCVASFNPGYQRGFRELKPSTRQRFVTYALQYPEIAIESEILHHLTEASPELCRKAVAFAHRVRNMHELNLKETVSTRLLVNALSLATAGMNPRLAFHVSLAETLSDDPQICSALRDLINLSF